MKFLSNRYAKVYSYKGVDICTLKIACPAKGDRLGYVIDDERFEGKEFEQIDDAVRIIEFSCRLLSVGERKLCKNMK